MFVAGKVTIDSEFIKEWVEHRNGWPAFWKGDEIKLFIGFPETLPDESVIPVDWETFVGKFEKDRLSFMYGDQEPDGELSRFYYFL